MGKFNEVKESVLTLYKAYSKDNSLSFNQITKKIASDLEIEWSDYLRVKIGRWLKKEGLREPETCKFDQDLDNDTFTETNQYLTTNNLSAVKPDGSIMDISTYCSVYGIPIEQVKSYKLVTHSAKGAYYNIASANLEEEILPEGLDIYSKIEELVESYKPKECKKLAVVNEKADLNSQRSALSFAPFAICPK